MPTTIILVRHGSTIWNAEHRYQGQQNLPLDDEGVRQAEEAAAGLRTVPIAAVYASPLERATKTAEIIVRALGGDWPVEPLPGLEEIDVGTWSGLTAREAQARFPAEYAAFEADKTRPRGGGESRQELEARAVAAVATMAAAHPDATVLAVTHAAVVKTLAGWAAHLPIECQPQLQGVANASYTYILVDSAAERRTRLAAYNIPSAGGSPITPELSGD